MRTILRCLLFVLSSLIVIGQVELRAADNDDDLYVLAKDLFRRGAFDAAITESKRYLFFNPLADSARGAYSMIARAYRSTGDTSRSNAAYADALRNAADDTERNTLRLELAVAHLAVGEYDLSLLTLARVIGTSEDSVQIRRAYLLQGMAYIYRFEWESARASLKNYVLCSPTTSESSVQLRLLDSIFLSTNDLAYRSPSLSLWLSTFIPGAGQIYCGEYIDGLNALTLNSLLISFMVESVVEQQFIALGLTQIPLFWRYYSGNRYHAEEYALQFNLQVQRSAARNILKAMPTLLADRP